MFRLLELKRELVGTTATCESVMKKTRQNADKHRGASDDLLFDRDAHLASTANTAERLSEGDEYFDLQQFVQDARQGYGT